LFPPGVSARDRCDFFEVGDLIPKQSSALLKLVAPLLKGETQKKIADFVGTRLKHLLKFKGEVGPRVVALAASRASVA
jgi:hypothetical protein